MVKNPNIIILSEYLLILSVLFKTQGISQQSDFAVGIGVNKDFKQDNIGPEMGQSNLFNKNGIISEYFRNSMIISIIVSNFLYLNKMINLKICPEY